MDVVKLSTCLSVTRAMIGVDRLNICLKQFTGGSQSNPWPLTTQQDVASLPVVAGVHTSKISAGKPPRRWPAQAVASKEPIFTCVIQANKARLGTSLG